MTFAEIFKKYSEIYLTSDGRFLDPMTSTPIGSVNPQTYITLLAKVNTTSMIYNTKLIITQPQPNLLSLKANNSATVTQQPTQSTQPTKKSIDLKELINQYQNLQVDRLTGMVRTTTEVDIATLPKEVLDTLTQASGKTINLDGETFYLSKDKSLIQLRNQSIEFSTLDDIIKFGLDNNVSNITITSDEGRYKINGKYHLFDKAFNGNVCDQLLGSRGSAFLENVNQNHFYSCTEIVNGICVNLKISKDIKTIITIDYIKNIKRELTEYFDLDWLNLIKERNYSEEGGIVIISEKQAYPEVTPLFLANTTDDDNTVVLYNKDIYYTGCNVLKYSSAIDLSKLTSITSDIFMLGITDIKENDWDSIFEIVDNGTVVVITVAESTIYSTLNMLTELFDKRYKYKKFVDALIGISVLKISYRHSKQYFDLIKDFVFNNKQFQTLLNTKSYDRGELTNQRYKHMTFKLTDSSKSIKDELHDILQYGIDHKAYDISLSAGSPPKFRIGGHLIDGYTTKKLQPHVTESIYLEIVKDNALQEQFKKDSGTGLSCAYSVQGLGRYRVSVYKQRGTISLSLRLISNDIWTMDKAGIPTLFQDKIKNYKQGLILVTGPVGTGKSTTLASILNYYNETRKGKIQSIEDPIEFLHRNKLSLFEQLEIGEDTTSYSNSLKRFLRNDTDITSIGEIRDEEVLKLALDMSVSGCLVLATLHTKNAVATINRIIEMTPSNERENIKALLAENLLATYTQLLIPKIGGGRVPATEIMLSTPAISTAIGEGTPEKLRTINNYISSGRSIGMRTMDFSIAELYNKNLITENDAKLFSQNSDILNTHLNTLSREE